MAHEEQFAALRRGENVYIPGVGTIEPRNICTSTATDYYHRLLVAFSDIDPEQIRDLVYSYIN